MRAEVTARPARWRLRAAWAFASCQSAYWLLIFPQARHELRRWAAQAAEIPDPALRKMALHKLRTEHLTAEGAAAFAVLAAPGSRRQVVRFCVAFEVLYDFVDGLGEQPVDDMLANNRRLYRALCAAVALDAPLEDYYAFHPQSEDGGYLCDLVQACRQALVQLAAHSHALPALARLTAQAAEAQSLHHAAGPADEALAAWAEEQQPSDVQLRWWEIAAAAGSPLGVFALAAAASHEETGDADVRDIERAYFPWIAALSWLLESLVDLGEDLVSGAPSYVLHYASPAEMSERLALIAGRAAGDAGRLPRAAYHLILLAGMVSMNLSHPGAAHETAREAAAAVERAVGGPVGLLVAVLRLRRRLR